MLNTQGAVRRIFLITLLLASGIIYLPTFSTAYFWDDCDFHYRIAKATSLSGVLAWLFEFHNEHFMPVIKCAYLVIYKLFWLDPIPFHLLILGLLLSTIILLYRLLQYMTKDHMTALIGAGIFALSTSYEMSIQLPSQSHMLFNLFFQVGMLHAVQLVVETGRLRYRIISFLFGLCAAASFAPGLLAGIWLVLFAFLCMSEIEKSRFSTKVKILAPPIAGWLMAVSIYLVSVKQAIWAEHYRQIGLTSALSAFSPYKGIVLTGMAIVTKLIPEYFASTPASLWLFAIMCCAIIVIRGRLPIRPIIFFTLWIVVNYGIVYAFRGAWGDSVTTWSRYSLFPAFGLAAIYALIAAAAIERLRAYMTARIKKILAVALVACILLVVADDAVFIERNTPNTMRWYLFCVEFRRTVSEYLRLERQSGDAPLRLEDKTIKTPYYPRPQPLSYYATFILAPDDLRRIVWGTKTDDRYMFFLRVNAHRYPIIIDVMESP